MAISSRDKKILVLIAALIASSLGYVYVLEPWLQGGHDVSGDQHREYKRLVSNSSAINERFNAMKNFAYWRETPQKQQIGLQLFIQESARHAGITDITSLRAGENADTSDITSIQMECTTGISPLKNLLSAIMSAEAPIRIEQLRIYPDESNPEKIKVHMQVSMLWQALGRDAK